MFRKGDTVVHPEHGAAVIEELREKEFLGETRTYLVLRVAYGDLTLMIPTDSTDQGVLMKDQYPSRSLHRFAKSRSIWEKTNLAAAPRASGVPSG